MSVQEAAIAVEVTHMKDINSMTLSQLKAFDMEATRILVQGTVASLVSMDTDPTSIANENIEVSTNLRHIYSYARTISKAPGFHLQLQREEF